MATYGAYRSSIDDATMSELLPELAQMASSSTATTSLRKVERRLRLEKIGSYRIGKTLGRGNFAQVRQGYHELSNKKVAIKIVDTQTLDPDNLAKINREIKILQQVSHPHIIKLYEVIKTERYWYIITEYVGGGELFDMLTDKGRQTEAEALRLFQQIVAAVSGCHGCGIVHRDIKAENLLLNKENNIKLIDFGFSNFQTKQTLLSTWCGSPPYAAPELLLGQHYDGTKSDVWSLGVILFTLVTASFPFPSDSVVKLKNAVFTEHVKIPFWVSVECSDLIRKMLTVSPVKRYSLAQVASHRWFTNGISDSMRQLIKSSLAGEYKMLSPVCNLTVDRKPSSKILDPAVLIFMQQHTVWSEDQIVEDVLKRNFEGPIYGSYLLLAEKLEDCKDFPSLSETDDYQRRGSRGSIISGKANVEPSQSQTTIPAHHLAKLNMSVNQDYDSDDSSASDLTATDDGTSPRYRSRGAYARRRMMLNLYDNIPEQHHNEQRRHTLCAADQFPARLATVANPIDSNALANAAAVAMANFARIQEMQRQRQQQLAQQQQAINGGMPLNLPFVNMSALQERRASANEALLGLNSYAHLLAACSTIGVTDRATNAVTSPAKTAQPPVPIRQNTDDEIQAYLSQRGASKRNTVHAVAGQSLLNGVPPGNMRHIRTPYAKQNGGSSNERRSSWASSSNSATGLLTAQQQSQLEKLYRQSVGAGGQAVANDNLNSVQQLQLEFQKLRACTQEQADASAPGQNRSFTNVWSSFADMKAPTISITDENNRSLPPISGSFDPIHNETTVQPQSSSTQQFGQPRPATVIGFTSNSSTASTPEGTCTVQLTGKPIVMSNDVKYYFIPVSLETALDRLPKFAAASDNLIFEVRPDTDLSKNNATVRFSHHSGVLFEMTLHRMDHSPNISRTEFTMLNGDANNYHELRKKLLAVFNEIY